ncbi:nucleotidyltransferase domain-containing protein [Reichenbachiella versicolor]|uniref:nucleotidyltransferase domain-containing protein n=1 Tax=Reichenbachiella versicolor TaxID=1821036 RepID=UPI000D6DFCA2|nr:nucleotidyltransferase domain-containing protein [Reichenbachiella versicolor]
MIALAEILAHLPKDKIQELETITQRIVDTQKAEMVVLFGSYARGTYSEKHGKIRGRKSDYDILVVARQRSTVREIKDLLENQFEDIDRIVNLEVHPIKFINSNIEDAHYFFLDVKREGIILYDTERFEFSDPVKITPKKRREIAEQDFEEWYEGAVIFFQKGKVSRKETNQKVFKNAAFQLQQCCEMCYTTVEMVFKHYRPREHKLEVLRRRMKKLDKRIALAFPQDTQEQKAFFEHLDYAYIGGRYLSEEDYSVTKEQLDYWTKEAKKLMKQTELVCKDRIECLIEIENKSRESL